MDGEFIKALEKYKIHPKNSSFYQTAFTHRSYLNETREKIESNERLEFLGDSVLSFIISSYLYNTRAHDPEGDLTNLRAYMVKTESLAKVARVLKLGTFLRLSRGEELSRGRVNPQILANTYEAVLGAVFLDLGIEAASKFVDQTLLPFFTEEIKRGAPRDPKSELQEVAQSRFQIPPKYKILSASGPDHAKTFNVGVFIGDKLIGKGDGSSKQQAEEEAAGQALLHLAKERY